MARRRKVTAHKCDMMAANVLGQHWGGSHRCSGVAVIRATFKDGREILACVGHGRQLRWQGLDGEKPTLDLVDPFPTLEEALDVIIGIPENFMSLACRDGAHDGCRVDFGSRICICECGHEMVDDGDFEEEI